MTFNSIGWFGAGKANVKVKNASVDPRPDRGGAGHGYRLVMAQRRLRCCDQDVKVILMLRSLVCMSECLFVSNLAPYLFGCGKVSA
jgi:hypothetical protein